MALTSIPAILLFIGISTVAVSYGWGMRGTTIGGEAGAMLPGALMGLFLALFSGSDFLREHFYLLSAAGALGMYFGGSMSYGETVGLISNENPHGKLTRELVGLFVKGGLWFGLFGAAAGMFLSFLTGRYYGLKYVLLFFGLMPLFAFCGSRIFDRPYDEDKGIHPRIYFSRTRPEGMGVLFGILVEMALFMIIKKDTVALCLTAGSTLSGGVGWVLAQILQIKGKFPNKKGKRFCGRLYEKGLVDVWKIMECSLGAFAGLGISITFVLIVKFSFKWQAYYEFMSIPQLTNLRPWILPAAFVALLGIDMLRHVIKQPPTEEELDWQLKRCLISGAEHAIAMRRAGAPPSRAFLAYEKIAHTALFPIYCVIPLFFLFLGSAGMAQLVSFYVLCYVIVEQQVFDRFNLFKTIWLWRIATLGFGFFIIFAQFFWHWTPGLFATVLLYGVGYEALTLVGTVAKNSPDRYKKKTVKESSLVEAYGGVLTTHGFFIVCIAIFTAFAAALAWK